MNRLRDESGFTLVELLVGIIMSLIVFSAGLTLLDAFQHQSQIDQSRNEVQDSARTTIDRMTRQLRNVAAETPTSAGALERSGPTDLVFQTVSSGTVFGVSNATNQMRVRYCLSTANPSNEILYTQTETWTSTVGPNMPSDGGQCPGLAASGWNGTTAALVTNITNNFDGNTRPVFTYAPLGSTAPAQINFVDVDLFLNLNPANPQRETELKSGIFLRNSFSAPIAGFTVNQTQGQLLLDASGSSDPNGQALTYQWSVDGAAVTGATAQQYNAGPVPSTALVAGSQHSVTLTVTSTGGLSDQTSQTVTIV